MTEATSGNTPSLFSLIESCYEEKDLATAQAACSELNGRVLIEAVFPQLQADEKYALLLKTLETVPDIVINYYAGFRVAVALAANRGDLLRNAGLEVVEPLLFLWQAKISTISSRARHALRRLRGREACEEMCRLALQENQILLRSVVLEAGFYPQEMRSRVLFFFLTAQWRQYEAIDFDYRLIKAIYEAAEPNLRQRIIRVARKAGRPELIPTIIGTFQPNRQLKAADWELLVNSLSEGKRWEAAWEVVKTAPAMHAVKLVKLMTHSGWQPLAEEDQLLLQELFSCTATLATDRFPFVPGYDPVFEYVLPFFEGAAFTPESRPRFVVSRDCQVAAALYTDCRLEVWRLKENKLVHTFERATFIAAAPLEIEDFKILNLAIDDSGTFLALFYQTHDAANPMFGYMRLNSDTGEVRAGPFLSYSSGPLPAFYGNATSPSLFDFVDFDIFRPDEHYSALYFCSTGEIIANFNNQIRVIDPETLNTRYFYPYRFAAAQVEFAFTNRNGYFLAGNTFFNLAAWDSRVQGQVNITDGSQAVFSKDDNYLAVANADGRLQLWQGWQTSLIRVIERLAEFSQPYSAVITPDKKYFITGHRNLLMFWSLPDLQLVNVVSAHYGPVRQLFFDDEQTLVSIGDDGKIKYWNSYLYKLAEKPMDKIVPLDLDRVREFRQKWPVNESGNAWLNFLDVYLHRRVQYVIEIGDFSPFVMAGADDIELETDAEIADAES